MKLTFLLLTIALLQVHAGSYAQSVSLSGKDLSLREIFAAIKKQTGYVVFYNQRMLANAKPVSVDVKDAAPAELLKEVLRDQPLDFVIEGQTIILSEKKIAVSGNIMIMIVAKGPITGIVRDSSGMGLPGASIFNRTTGKAVQTNAKGAFTIEASENDVLVVTFVGYLPMEKKVTTSMLGDQSFTITMREMLSVLDERVVKGYYSTTKVMNTGSVSTVRSDVISRQPVGDPMMALQGRVPGLSITQHNGVPGSNFTIRLRGQNSIANGNNPLFIVDGVPFPTQSLTWFGAAGGGLSPFSAIRPEDIESVDVLKDADATAIYGSRGANGVILITTKKGKPGKSRVDVTGNATFTSVPTRLKLMNTQQYLEMRREAHKNDNEPIQEWAHDLLAGWDTTRFTDWQDFFLGKTAVTKEGKVSLSGGTMATQFLLSAGYRKEGNLLPGNYYNEFGSLNSSLNHTNNNGRLNVIFSLGYTTNRNELPMEDGALNIYLPPYAPAVYKENGELNWENGTFANPLAFLMTSSSNRQENIIGNVNISYKLTDDLTVRVSGGYNSMRNDQQVIHPAAADNPAEVQDPFFWRWTDVGQASTRTWNLEPQLAFNRSFGKHRVEAMIGSSFQETLSKRHNMSAYGFSSDEAIQNPAGGRTINAWINNNQYRYNAIFARLGYQFNDKYSINLTGNRDGSSRFGPGRQFGNFGSIGAAWIFSRENFVAENLPWLSLGKIRSSIGKTGNDQLEDYAYLSLYWTSNGYQGLSGLVPSRLTNPFYGWETINKFEVAVETGFFDNDILLTANYYRNRTKNQLVGYSLPDITGFNSINANLPAVLENSGFEFVLSTINLKQGKFTWKSDLNLSVPRNKLVSYPNIEASPYANRYAVGKPLSVQYNFRYTGIDPNTGLYTFEDMDKNGVLSWSKDQYPVFFGQRWYGGLNNSFEYKGVTLDVFLQYVDQLTRDYGERIPGLPYRIGNNLPLEFLDRWQKPGDQAKYQRYTAGAAEATQAFDQFRYSDGSRMNGSFLRIKNVQLAWNLPASLMEQLKINSVRVYAQAQNLVTISNFNGLDPESRGLAMPPLRVMNVGFQISL